MLNQRFLAKFSWKRKLGPAALGAIIAVSLLVLALSPLCGDILGVKRENAALAELFECSGAELNSVNVTGWVRIDERAAGNREPLELADLVADRLGLAGEGRSYESWQNPYARGISLKGRLGGVRAVSIAGQTMEIAGTGSVSHVMVSLDGVNGKKTAALKRKIRRALDGCGGECLTAVTYAGKIKSPLQSGELLTGAEKMMGQAGASIKEKTVQDNLVSLTGLSPQFKSDLRYGEKQINLNVALRTSPAEQVTYVYAATPVIFMEY